MARALMTVFLSGLVLVLSSWAQTSPPPKSNSDLRKLMLTPQDVQEVLKDPKWEFGSASPFRPAVDFGAVASQSVIIKLSNQQFDIQLASFVRDDRADQEQALLYMVHRLLAEAEAAKAEFRFDFRKVDNAYRGFLAEFNKDTAGKDVEDRCKATEIALIRATQRTGVGFDRSLKLILRLAALPGVPASLELASNVAVANQSDDAMLTTLLTVSKAQRDKMCVKPQ
jgi:hypothetical protein